MGRQLEELAGSVWPVLITGETGVGKEFLAHAMYKMSPHHQRVFLFLDLLRPMIPEDNSMNYCELPEETADPTEQQMRLFFGSETRGEGQSRIETPGYLELTEEGTLLVRGMEHLTLLMQNRLLFTLKNGKFKKVGAVSYQNCDTRIIGTTNLDVSEISADKQPLLHWMLEHSLHVPPLRHRRKEIPILVQHYVRKIWSGTSQRSQQATERNYQNPGWIFLAWQRQRNWRLPLKERSCFPPMESSGLKTYILT